MAVPAGFVRVNAQTWEHPVTRIQVDNQGVWRGVGGSTIGSALRQPSVGIQRSTAFGGALGGPTLTPLGAPSFRIPQIGESLPVEPEPDFSGTLGVELPALPPRPTLPPPKGAKMGLFDSIIGGIRKGIGAIGGATVEVLGEVVEAASEAIPELAEAYATVAGQKILGIEPPQTQVVYATPPGGPAFPRTPTAERVQIAARVTPQEVDQVAERVIQAGMFPAIPAAVGALAPAARSLASRYLPGLAVGEFIPDILPSALEGLQSLFGGGNGEIEPSPGRGIRMGEGSGLFHTTPVKVRYDPRTGQPYEVGGNRVPNTLTLVDDPMTGRMEFFVHAGRPTHFSKLGKYPRARSRPHTHKVKHRHAPKKHGHGHHGHYTAKQLKAGFGGKRRMRG